MFKLAHHHLLRLSQINGFATPADRLIFFGVRGCTPVNPDDTFRKEHILQVTEIDYVHPRCTLGQWLPAEKKLAVFPGSTVPHIKHVKISVERNGLGANQLMTGYYADYRKGIHKFGKPTAHPAFRQIEAHPIRRTADDFDFDNDDRVEFENPYDNIHAGWSMGVSHDDYASAGCQVVVGYPACPLRKGLPDAGAWKVFKANAYTLEQEQFPYLLLNAAEVQAVALKPNAKWPAKVRFGSSGPLVSRVQQALRKAGPYEGKINGVLDARTLRAVLAFQTMAFGPAADDGIVGPLTASAMTLDWPKV